MRTFESRLFTNKEQDRLLMRCLMESRHIYNGMLERVKTQYEQSGTFPSKYDLENAFKGQGEHVPATTVQVLADRLSKSLKPFLAAKPHNIPDIGFPASRNRTAGTPSNSDSTAKTHTWMRIRSISSFQRRWGSPSR